MRSELLGLIGDAEIVRPVLPLIAATQLGGRISPQVQFTRRVSLSAPLETKQRELSDEDRLTMAAEPLPRAVALDSSQRLLLIQRLKQRHPVPFELRRQHKDETRRAQVTRERRELLQGCLFWGCVMIAFLVGAVLVIGLVAWLA